MRKASFLPLFAAALFLGACSSPTVYPIFPAEETGKKDSSFETGYRYERGLGVPRDYARAITAYRAADKAGDVRATNNLAVMTLHGKGTSASPWTAYRLFQRASKAGSSNARYNLGLMHELGIGRTPSPIAAAYEYRAASEMGHAQAQQRLAALLERGNGVPRMEGEAQRLYGMAAVGGDAVSMQRLREMNGADAGMPLTTAAEMLAVHHCDCGTSAEAASAARGISELRRMADAGDSPARYNLAVRLLKGEGSVQDPSEAARLFTLAAKQGYAPAQRQLAQMHLRGQAVARSKVLAHAWLNLASRDPGVEGTAARAEMDSLEITMSNKDIAEAQGIAFSGALAGR